jgi:hypothetical protein
LLGRQEGVRGVAVIDQHKVVAEALILCKLDAIRTASCHASWTGGGASVANECLPMLSLGMRGGTTNATMLLKHDHRGWSALQ